MAAEKGNRPPNAGKGRVKGVPNKITSDLREMILSALEEAGGAAYLKKQAKENPAAFMTLIGKCLPRDVVGHLGPSVIEAILAVAAEREAAEGKRGPG